jgi:hypothetical protein
VARALFLTGDFVLLETADRRLDFLAGDFLEGDFVFLEGDLVRFLGDLGKLAPLGRTGAPPQATSLPAHMEPQGLHL